MRRHSFGISEKMYILRTREEAASASKEREEDEEKKRTSTKRVKWPLVTPSTRMYMMRFSIRSSSSISTATVAMADIIVAYHSTPHAASVYILMTTTTTALRDAANRRVCERGHRLRLTVYRSRRHLRNAHTLCSGTQHDTHHAYMPHSHTRARTISRKPSEAASAERRTERQERTWTSIHSKQEHKKEGRVVHPCIRYNVFNQVNIVEFIISYNQSTHRSLSLFLWFDRLKFRSHASRDIDSTSPKPARTRQFIRVCSTPTINLEKKISPSAPHDELDCCMGAHALLASINNNGYCSRYLYTCVYALLYDRSAETRIYTEKILLAENSRRAVKRRPELTAQVNFARSRCSEVFEKCLCIRSPGADARGNRHPVQRLSSCWQFVRVHTYRLTHIHTRTFTYILWLRKSGKIAPNVKSTKSSTSLSSGVAAPLKSRTRTRKGRVQKRTVCAAGPCRWRTVYTRNINGFQRATLQSSSSNSSNSSTCSLVREIHADQDEHSRIYYICIHISIESSLQRTSSNAAFIIRTRARTSGIHQQQQRQYSGGPISSIKLNVVEESIKESKVDGASSQITMTMDVSKSETGKNGTTQQECHGCRKTIKERYLLKALDAYWHEDCLKCNCCDCRLGEVGSTLYTKANLILCRRDYLRLFGNTGLCSACNKPIPAFEMVMRAKNNVYHLECFACQQCYHRSVRDILR
ncbi:unnamed protein product, partial [Trichogramma brassicae]